MKKPERREHDWDAMLKFHRELLQEVKRTGIPIMTEQQVPNKNNSRRLSESPGNNTESE